jgi:hypothetical protein
MQMRVEDLLARSLPIGEEQVHPLAADVRRSEAGADLSGNLGYPTPGGGSRFSEIRCMKVRDDEYVTRVNGLDVHEGRAQLVAIDEAGIGPPRYDVTKDAFAGLHNVASGAL